MFNRIDILDQFQKYLGGNRKFIPYTGNFTSIRNTLNLSNFLPSDPNCRYLTFYNGKLVDEGPVTCNETMMG